MGARRRDPRTLDLLFSPAVTCLREPTRTGVRRSDRTSAFEARTAARLSSAAYVKPKKGIVKKTLGQLRSFSLGFGESVARGQVSSFFPLKRSSSKMWLRAARP